MTNYFIVEVFTKKDMIMMTMILSWAQAFTQNKSTWTVVPRQDLVGTRINEIIELILMAAAKCVINDYQNIKSDNDSKILILFNAQFYYLQTV